jgi:hypothetical protein
VQGHQEDVAVLDDDRVGEVPQLAERTVHTKQHCSRTLWVHVADYGKDSMKIAMLAPPWIEIPPPGYGGIEQVLALLAAELTERGNDVTLFAAPGTRSRAEVLSPLESPHPDEIQLAVYEADHVASTFARMEETEPPFDVLHDNCGFTAFAFADRIDTPSTLGTPTRRAWWRSAATRPSRRPTRSRSWP